MKLLIINYMALPVPPSKGGAVEYLVDSFLKHNEKTHLHDITLYSIYDEKAELMAKGYKHAKFNFIKIQSVWDKLDRVIRHFINRIPKIYVGNTYISKIIRQERNLNQYDAVIIENAPEFGLKIPKSFKNKLCLHLHNDYLNNTSKNAEKIFDCYDEIYTISDTLGLNVQTIKKSEKVKTLYNGVDLNRFTSNEEKKREIREKYNICEDDFVFMFCGRIAPDKGVLELVEAFSNIKNDKLRLVIVGGTGYSKNEMNTYTEKVHSLADDRVIFTGFVPYEEIHTLYALADVGVAPSIIRDAFNLTVVEFASNAVPLIISDMGAMKELVNDKCSVIAKYDDDFVKNIEDALRKMAECENLNEMKKEAFLASRKFSIEAYCERYNNLLSE